MCTVYVLAGHEYICCEPCVGFSVPHVVGVCSISFLLCLCTCVEGEDTSVGQEGQGGYGQCACMLYRSVCDSTLCP